MDVAECRQVRSLLEPAPRSVRAARVMLRTCLTEWGLSGWYDAAAVTVSELVTNGVIHAKTTLTLQIGCDDEWLQVSVQDASPAPVQQRPHRQDVEADLVTVARAERHLGQPLDERDMRLDVGAAGTLAGGRGLLLVEALADQWGVTPHRDGKAVWARFALKCC